MNLFFSSALFAAVPCTYDLYSASQYRDFLDNFLLAFRTLFLVFLSFSVLLLRFYLFQCNY